MSKTTDSMSSTCVLCCQDTKLFAIGPCDHPICTKCSTRMRVLCEQKYCSVCRNEMRMVLFVKKVHPYASIISHKFLYDKKAGIRFASGWMKNEFEDYLCHKCPKCPKDVNQFKTMKLLEEHMRRNHELFYCNLCLVNVKVFTSERPLYNRRDLAIHKRKGDADNTSYRGHPLCEFCDVRFYDNDELLKHLRRQHYFCHFCENDGITNQYYDNYDNLRDHFRQKHYLCEEDGCIDEEFTAAFRTEVDLKAHKASKHAGKMSRKEARQTRQLNWEFNYTSHRANHRDGVITGADYNETRGAFRGRGHGSRYQSNREYDDTAKALEASLKPDTVKEQRPPKRRDKPRGERTEKVVKQANVKPDEKKERPFKEDEFEKRRGAAAAAASGRKQKQTKLVSNSDDSKNAPSDSDWSMGNKLTSCQFTESTWTREGGSPKLSKASQLKRDDKVEEKSKKVNSAAPKISEPTREPTPVKKEVDKSLKESDFPSLGGKALSSSATGWGKAVPTASEFPSLGSAALPHKLKPTPNGGSSVSTAVSRDPESPVDFSKAIAANAMLHDKKKKAAFKPPPQPPPPTQFYQDFPTLSSIANILKAAPEPKQAWAKSKQSPGVVMSTGKTSKASTSMNSQTTSQQKNIERSGKEKNQQTAKSKSEKEKKSNIANCLHTKDQPKSEKAERSKPSNTEKPSAVDPKPVKSSKSKDDSRASDFDSDSRTRMPPGFPQEGDSTPKRQPPGFSVPAPIPPPGFDTGSLNPPPGFSAAFGFAEPNDFKQRNKDLIDQIQSHLNYSPDGFSEFKRLSGQFRQGNLSGKDYYERCSTLLGKDNFQNIFPDLVSLLPDPIKQQELLLVNNDYKILAKEKGEKVLSIKKKGKGSSVWNSQGQSQNTMCNNCGQVLLQKDLISHTNICSTNADFPSLSAASASSAPRQTATAWGRVK